LIIAVAMPSCASIERRRACAWDCAEKMELMSYGTSNSRDQKSLLGTSEELGLSFKNIMGHYKGRVNVRQRKRRFAKNQRIKALAANKKKTTSSRSISEEAP
jgi:hypothetical protein